MPTVSSLLSEFNTKLQEVAAKVGVAGRYAAGPQVLTSEQAMEQYEIELPDENYFLKLLPTDTGFDVSYVTPDQWEITGAGEYISPEGTKYTADQLKELEATYNAQQAKKTQLEQSEFYNPDTQTYNVQGLIDSGLLTGDEATNYFGADWNAPPPTVWTGSNAISQGMFDQETGAKLQETISEYENILSSFGNVFSQAEVDEAIQLAITAPDEFVNQIREIGRNEQTEKLLKLAFDATDDEIDYLFDAEEWVSELRAIGWNEDTEARLKAIYPDLVEDDIRDFFAIQPTAMQQATNQLGQAWNLYVSELFNKQESGMELANLGKSLLGVVGETLDKYVNTVWMGGIEIIRAYTQIGEANVVGLPGAADYDREFVNAIHALDTKYGMWSVFTDEYREVIDKYRAGLPLYVRIPVNIAEFSNPVYLVPVGGLFGLAAKVTTKIPIIGKALKYTASGVQAIEGEVAGAIAAPVKLVAGKLEQAGIKLGAKLADDVIAKSKLLEDAALIPATDDILKGVLVDNWQKKLLQIASKIPAVKKGIWNTLGYRSTISLATKEIENVVGRGAVAYNEITRRGTNAANIKLSELRAIEQNPTRLFGFNNEAMSQSMLKKLKPEFVGLRESGTLEHVFTHSEMYNLSAKQATYIARVQEVNKWATELLKKEGITVNETVGDWIHRIVEQGGKETPITRRSIGAKQAFEKARKFDTMFDGIQYFAEHPELKAHYNPNIEASVSSYIQQVYSKVASKRFEDYVAKFGFGSTAKERLAKMFPGVAEKAELTASQLKKAAFTQGAIRRAFRGERLTEQTLKSIEKDFPEIGARLRDLNRPPTLPVTEGERTQQIINKAKLDSEFPKQVDEFGYPKGISEPVLTTEGQRLKALSELGDQIKQIVESRKAPYWQARVAKAEAMEIAGKPSLQEGYIMQPFAGGKIYSQEFIDNFNQFLGHQNGLPGFKVTSDISGIMRIAIASMDFSGMAIQGLPSWGLAHAYMLTNPAVGVKLMGAWYKAFAYSIGSFFDPQLIAKYIAKNQDTILRRTSMFGGSARAVDWISLEAKTGGIAGLFTKVTEKDPFKLYKRAEMSFFAGGEMVRDEFFKIMEKGAIKRGEEYQLATFLDTLTGLYNSKAVGVPLTARQLESSFVWFAPNYTRACLSILSDIFRGGMVGAEARKAIGGMMAGGAAYYVGVQYALSIASGKDSEQAWNDVLEGFGVVEDPITGDVSWKMSANFMTIEIRLRWLLVWTT
jgi:hypothetical protein